MTQNSAENMTESEPGTEVTILPNYSDDELRNLTSFDEAMALVADALGGIETADEVIGDGFAVLDDKSRIAGLPILFMEWTFNNGDFGPFASARVAVQTGQRGEISRFIINDGSEYGIMGQLRAYSARTGRLGGLLAKRGLRVSKYEIPDPTGKSDDPIPAQTYYIDTSA